MRIAFDNVVFRFIRLFQQKIIFYQPLNQNKITAVEWFNQQLVDRQNGNGDSRSRDEIFEQAKEMEKEQIKDSYCDGRLSIINKQIISAEQYYNKTFKQEEQ